MASSRTAEVKSLNMCTHGHHREMKTVKRVSKITMEILNSCFSFYNKPACNMNSRFCINHSKGEDSKPTESKSSTFAAAKLTNSNTIIMQLSYTTIHHKPLLLHAGNRVPSPFHNSSYMDLS